MDTPTSPSAGVRIEKPEGGVKVDTHVASPKVEAKGHGFGLKMPKFGKGSSSSSSEDDGTGKRVKKVKGGAKIDANINVSGPKSPHVDIKGGAKGEIKGEVGIKADVKSPKVDAHAHAHAKGDAGGGFGIKVPKFGFGHSSSSSEDDGTGKRVKKVKGPKVEIDANISVPKVSAGKEVDVKGGVKGPNVSVPKATGGKEFEGKIDLKASGGADLHAKGGVDVGAKVGGDAGGKGGFGFGIKVPKFGEFRRKRCWI